MALLESIPLLNQLLDNWQKENRNGEQMVPILTKYLIIILFYCL